MAKVKKTKRSVKKAHKKMMARYHEGDKMEKHKPNRRRVKM